MAATAACQNFHARPAAATTYSSSYFLFLETQLHASNGVGIGYNDFAHRGNHPL
jgi:hypothetical protein